MPVLSITTTARDVFLSSGNVTSVSFKNGSSTGTIYLRNKQVRQNIVTSSDFEWSLAPGAAVGLTVLNDGTGIVGPWQAISDTGGGVNLEILEIFKDAARER